MVRQSHARCIGTITLLLLIVTPSLWRQLSASSGSTEHDRIPPVSASPSRIPSLVSEADGDLAQTQGQVANALLAYQAAFDSDRDLNLSEADRTRIETKYCAALSHDTRPARFAMLLRYAKRVLCGDAVAYERKLLGINAAEQVLHTTLKKPSPKDMDTYAATVLTLLAAPVSPWDANRQGTFLISMLEDHNHAIWVGTEDYGVWRHDPISHEWRQFTTKDGLGDDNGYALACDNQKRVWVGHLNHGVSVYEPKSGKWRNYGAVDGPLGSRVFAICINPVNSDVWIATDLGLTRYSVANDTWSYYTRSTRKERYAMRHQRFLLPLLLMIGTTGYTTTIAPAASLPSLIIYSHDYSNPAFTKDLAQIDQLRSQQDIKGLDALAQSIQTTWGHQENLDYYYVLSDKVVAALKSTGVTDVAKNRDKLYEKEDLARKYALVVLERQDVPLDVAPNLLMATEFSDTLDISSGRMSSAQWQAQRSKHMLIWFTTWQRFEKNTEPTIDPKMQAPGLDTVIAEIAATDAGSKENIAARARYWELRRTWNDRYTLVQCRKQYLRSFKSFVIQSYTSGPADQNELNQYLTQYIGDTSLRSTILDAVATKQHEPTPTTALSSGTRIK